MPPAMKRLLANVERPTNRFDRRALVEVHLRLAQLRNDLLRRVSLPFHRVLPPSRAVRLSYQLVHLEGVRSVCASILRPRIGVAIGPGLTAFTRMPCPTSSAAITRVNERTAALLAE